MATQKSYYRTRFPKSKCRHNTVSQSLAVNYDGFGFDLSNHFTQSKKAFIAKFRDMFLKHNPNKTKVSAELACGAVWTICKEIQKGDIVICPSGRNDKYLAGEVIGDYSFWGGNDFRHHRKVVWARKSFVGSHMSQGLRNLIDSGSDAVNITNYAEELERLISGTSKPQLTARNAPIEDASGFASEEDLEDFLVRHWASTELGQKYNIYEVDGKIVGQQFQVDTGRIDILAISKDQKELLVIEIKQGKAKDAVVGQVLRYIGYVKEELAEPWQEVRGAIIASEDSERFKRALSATNNIDFYRYHFKFSVSKE